MADAAIEVRPARVDEAEAVLRCYEWLFAPPGAAPGELGPGLGADRAGRCDRLRLGDDPDRSSPPTPARSRGSAPPIWISSRSATGCAAGSRTSPSTPTAAHAGSAASCSQPHANGRPRGAPRTSSSTAPRPGSTPTASTSARAAGCARSASAGTGSEESRERRDPLGVHRARRPSQRRQVDARQLAGRLEGGDRLRPAADDPARRPRRRDRSRRLLADGAHRSPRRAEAARRPDRAHADAGRARASRFRRGPLRPQRRAGGRARRPLHRIDDRGGATGGAGDLCGQQDRPPEAARADRGAGRRGRARGRRRGLPDQRPPRDRGGGPARAADRADAGRAAALPRRRAHATCRARSTSPS